MNRVLICPHFTNQWSFAPSRQSYRAPPAGTPIIQANQPVITTQRTSEPLVEDAAAPLSPENVLGPFEPGISHMETTIPPFEDVVDYHHSRLRDTASTPNVNEKHAEKSWRNRHVTTSTRRVLHRNSDQTSYYFMNSTECFDASTCVSRT